MRMTLKTTIVAGILAVGGLLALTSPAEAGGCGGGGRSSRGGYGGGHSFGRAYTAQSQCGGGCNMAGMNMGAMPMQGASMQGMNMNGNAAPAVQPTAAAGAYFCPMHPGVVSAVPATCPYCAMVLKKR